MEYEGSYSDSLTDTQWRMAAVAQYAQVHGEDKPGAAWILSPFDTWEPNPAYAGPPQPHPESGDYPVPYFLTYAEAMVWARVEAYRTGRVVKVTAYGPGWVAGV